MPLRKLILVPAVRKILIVAVGTSLPLLLCLVVIEIAMRVMPVPNGMRAEPVTAETPVFHFTPDREVSNSVGWQAEPQYVSNVLAETPPERMALSREVVDAFFRDLPYYAGVAPDRILLMLDGIRPQLYDDAALAGVADSYFAQMRAYFMGRAAALGYEVMDLQPRFVARYRAEGRRFEDPVDAHWNALGHEEAAAAVEASGLFRTLFGETQDRSCGNSGS